MSSQVKSVFICSGIKGLQRALNDALPNLAFKEIAPEDLVPDKMKDWKNEIIIMDNLFIGPLLYTPKEKISFIQGTWAGLDKVLAYVKPNAPNPEIPIARFADPSFSQLMAEYTVAHVINRERRFPEIAENQRNQSWMKTEFQDYRCLNELNIGILGVGQIGKTIAKIFKAFGCQIHGLTRQSPPRSPSSDVDHYYSYDQIKELLQQTDYICSVLPRTPETDDIIGNDVLEACKGKRTTLINIGRGNIISDSDLVKALDSNWLHHAVLDVFNEEPLPQDNPLWMHKKVTVTPHVAAVSLPRHIAECFKTNYLKVTQGQEPDNVADWKNLY